MRADPRLLPWPTTLRVACVAGVDPRSVDRVRLELPTRESVRVRVMAALLDMGLVSPAETPPNGPSRATAAKPTPEENT
jgi:hypothetical protein